MVTANLPERDCEVLGRQLDAFACDVRAARAAAVPTVAGLSFHGRDRTAANGSRHGEHVELAGGAGILIRPVEPDDDAALRSAYERLGELSRFRGSLTSIKHLNGSRLYA